MTFNIFKYCSMCFVVAITSLCSGVVSADYLEDLTTNQTVLFQFGSYVQGSTYAFTAEGLDIDIPASGDSFGGTGVAAITTVGLTGVTALEVTARLDAGNGSPLILSIREDNGMGGDGEFFAYSIAASEFTPGSFVTVSIDPTSFFFNGDATDGVLNGVLNNTSIQSPFGGTASQNFTVASVNYVGASVAIPEPATAAILLGLCPMIAIRRRR